MSLTVVMPVYNSSNYLSEAIESILSQSFKDFVFVILNDNSTDNSEDIINEYAKKDNRIEYHKFDKNYGPAYLRNYAIQNAQTEYIALMDSDDISLPSRFEKQLNFLNENKEIGVCGSWFTIFGNIETRVVTHFETHDEIKVNFLNECYIGNPTVIFRRNILENYLFDKSYNPMDDYELWSRLIYITNFHNIPESLLKYRWHDKNISHNTSVNLSTIHKRIRFNQLKNLSITGNFEDNMEYLHALHFEKKQTLNSIYKILKAAQKLINNNSENKVYNPTLLNEIITTSLVKTITEKDKYSFKLLFLILINHFQVFKALNLKEKRKFIKRCLF